MDNSLKSEAPPMGSRSVKLPDDFTVSTVPDANTVSGWRVGLVIIGMGVNFNAFALAAQTVIDAGFVRGVAACLVGACILAVGGALTGYIGAKQRLSVFVILRHTFGRVGASIVNLFLTLLAFGFFCVLVSMLGNSLGAIAGGSGHLHSALLWSAVASLLVALATLYGFNALQAITYALLPLLMLGLGFLAVTAVHAVGLASIIGYRGVGGSFGTSVSAVLGGLVGFVVVFPNLTRYARTPRDGAMAGIIGMAIGFPLILVLSAVASVAAGQKDVVGILSGLGLGLAAITLAALSIWKTNVLNLYTVYLGLSALRPSISRWQVIVFVAAAGAVLGSIDINTYFMPFLLVMGVMAPPIAVIYTIDCFARPADSSDASMPSSAAFHLPALLSWASASTIGAFALLGEIRWTGIASLDSMIVAVGLFGIFKVKNHAWRDARSDL